MNLLIIMALGALALMATKKAAAAAPAPEKEVEIKKNAGWDLRRKKREKVVIDRGRLEKLKDAIRKAQKKAKEKEKEIPIKTGITPENAAKLLQAYMIVNRTFGPSDKIKEYQRQMGGDLAPDGIVGPKTRNRAAALGVKLPNASQIAILKASPVKAAAAKGVIAKRAVADKQKKATAPSPAPAPAPTAPVYQPVPAEARALPGGGYVVMPKATDPKAAAIELRNYLSQSGANWGSKARPSAAVAKGQSEMGGGLVADGIFGPATRARALALGIRMPRR